MKKDQETTNTQLVFVGQTSKKNFKYMVIISANDSLKAGDIVNFSRKIVSGISVGSAILCNTDDGQTFNRFKWATLDQRRFVAKYHTDEIQKWSAAERVFLEQQKIERANKTKSADHIDHLISDIAKSTRKMTTRDKLSLINYISNQILIQK